MSEESPHPDSPDDAPQEEQLAKASLTARLTTQLMRLRAWAAVHWMRSAAIAIAILVLVTGTVATWAYLASVAIQVGQLTLGEALEALDQGRYRQARTLVHRMLESGRIPRSAYGGPLFVLGAIKTNDAEMQAIAERRRAEYLIASRYLKEARHYGFPSQRISHGYFLLGKSLLESSQYVEGIEVLEEALADKMAVDEPLAIEIRRVLAETCLLMPYPDLERALAHNSAYLSVASLSPNKRTDALLVRAEILGRMERFEEARETVAPLVLDGDSQALAQLLQAQLILDDVEFRRHNTAPQDLASVNAAAMVEIDQAVQLLTSAQSVDERATDVTRRSQFLMGRAHELRGDDDAALQHYVRTRQLYPDTPAGMAATLAEADINRRRGEPQAALIGYRRVLEHVADLSTHRNRVLPFAELRRRVHDAMTDFVDRQHFDEALTMIARFVPLFSRTEQLELRAETLEQWGELLLGQSAGDVDRQDSVRAAGLRHLREAGMAREQLAAERFGSSHYTDDLWRSAEDYFRGHSYSSTVRLLNKYLEHEPEYRNSQALLRLGQAQLALGNISDSIAALKECIEFHPRDSATYQARIDCARAHWFQGDTGAAEQLLRDNLTGSTLKPSSREWKDSLFALGLLLHETEQHEQAISTLEEAVERYPQDPQVLLAQYVTGESYRRWADDLLERVRQSRTTNEREKYSELAAERLNDALRYFGIVQRSITLKSHGVHDNALMGAMLRNCYMLEGTVLFNLGKYEQAIKAFSNVSSLYPNDPFVLETFVQIANCWRRLDRPNKARGAAQQALIALDQLPRDADFTAHTSFDREEWRLLLSDMSRW